MNQSKTGLNDSFYKWIDQVRRSKRKLPELQEKLEYYKIKLIGYHGISYDQIGSGTSNKNGDENLLYWIDKINQVEDEIEYNKEIINELEVFKSYLNEEQKLFFTVFIDRKSIASLLEELSLKRSHYYRTLSLIIRKYIDKSN